MANAPTDQRSTTNDPPPADGGHAPDEDASSIAPPHVSGNERPRLIEEHHVVGRYGEDELEATDDRGRRWYHLRPQPRGRYDMIGFNYTWWLIWIFVIFVIFLPWGHGWGY